MNAIPSELQSITKAVFTTNEFERIQERFSFRITWKRESHIDLERILTPAPKRVEVLGTLEATIPYVLVRDEIYCKAFATLRSKLTFEVYS